MSEEPEEAILRITARYVAEVRAGQQPGVGDYIACYPQYRNAIVDFALYYHAVEANGVEEFHAMPLSEVSRVTLERVVRALPPAHATKPVTSLLTSDAYRFTSSQLALQLDVSIDIVQLLELHAIDAATIPYELYTRLAMTLHQPVSAVQAYLASPPNVLNRSGENRQLRVAEKQAQYPAQEERGQAFRHVLESSALVSVEQKSRWHAILTLEDL